MSSQPEGGVAGGVPPAASPHRVHVPANIHRWDEITFLHWPFAPSDVVPLLADGLQPVTWEGAAWVGVTPFRMRVRPPGIPLFPPGWSFPETNVRTYVAGPDGREGLWFLHMEVTALWFVAVLRSLGLPYVQRRMRIDRAAGSIRYRSQGVAGAGGHDITVRVGKPLHPREGGGFERFLTARWNAYHRRAVLLRTPVEHEPWPLRSATVERCEVDGLLRAAGLPPPNAPPVAHFSPGVTVKVGVPQLARQPR